MSQKTEVIDLNNKFVVPGFMDNHTHFMSGGSMLMSIDLHSANTPDVFNSRFQSYVKNIEPGEWITGGNWDHEHWGGLLPSRLWIDSIQIIIQSWFQEWMVTWHLQILRH